MSRFYATATSATTPLTQTRRAGSDPADAAIDSFITRIPEFGQVMMEGFAALTTHPYSRAAFLARAPFHPLAEIIYACPSEMRTYTVHPRFEALAWTDPQAADIGALQTRLVVEAEANMRALDSVMGKMKSRRDIEAAQFEEYEHLGMLGQTDIFMKWKNAGAKYNRKLPNGPAADNVPLAPQERAQKIAINQDIFWDAPEQPVEGVPVQVANAAGVLQIEHDAQAAVDQFAIFLANSDQGIVAAPYAWARQALDGFLAANGFDGGQLSVRSLIFPGLRRNGRRRHLDRRRRQ